MLHVLARDGFEDQPTSRPLNKAEALKVIKLGAPVTVVTRNHLPPARSFHDKDRTFVQLMPDCGAPDDPYFLKAQYADVTTQKLVSFTCRITVADTAVTVDLLDTDAIAPPLAPYMSALRALETGLDAFEALALDVARTQDARHDWISDQDRWILNALLDDKDSVLDQLNAQLNRLCRAAEDAAAQLRLRHTQRTALWTQVPTGALLVEMATNGDHLRCKLARKTAPIGLGEHHRYVVLHPDHLDGLQDGLHKMGDWLPKALGVPDLDQAWTVVKDQAQRNAALNTDLSQPHVTGPKEFKGIADPTLPIVFDGATMHDTFRVPAKDWKPDGARRAVTRGYVWQLGGEYGRRGMPSVDVPGGYEDTLGIGRAVHWRRLRGLGTVVDPSFDRHLVASRRLAELLPDTAFGPAPPETARPDLPDHLYYLDPPRRPSGIRFDPEFLGYRLRSDLLKINPFHRNPHATDAFTWRERGLSQAVEDDVLVIDAPDPLPDVWRASDFGKDGLDYLMMSDALVRKLDARNMLDGVARARVGIAL